MQLLKEILTDYKVSVLAVSESYVNKDMQKLMSADNQLKVDDIGKIIGVWNAMVKRMVSLVKSLVHQ